jgi:hypothetical protein
MATLSGAPPTADPLTIAHTQELTQANDRAKAIRRAARVAGFNGWVGAIVALCSVPFAFFSMLGLAAAVVLVVVAWNEFRGRKRLLAFDSSAANLLGWNQLGLMAAVVAYCLWMIYASLANGNPLAELNASPEVGDLLGSKESFELLYRQFVYGFYGLVILLTVVFQGGNAYYYFTRRPYIERYCAQTPEWVRELQRAALVS